MLEFPRKAWQYLPGQRRVRMSPELGYDTPNAATAGTSTYDDSYVFSGGLDRFDWKLVGKQEMYIPYNSFKWIDKSKKYKDVYLDDSITVA